MKARLSFANVTSALALFVALGGTSYAAVNLTSNSVDSRHIRSGAVGKSEIRPRAVAKWEIRSGAVGKSEIRRNAVGASEIGPKTVDTTELSDGGVALADLAPAARNSLADAKGVTFRVASTSTGTAAGGNAKSIVRDGVGEYTVGFTSNVGECQYSASVAGAKTGTTIEQPPVGLATAAPGTDATKVLVKTYDAAGAPLDAPFHLLVAC